MSPLTSHVCGMQVVVHYFSNLFIIHFHDSEQIINIQPNVWFNYIILIIVTLSAKNSLILRENKAVFCREGHKFY